MREYSGPFLTPEGFVQAEITVDDGSEIVDFEEGGDSGKNVIVLPAFYNSHTHMGDYVAKNSPDGTIPEIVGPGGLKHNILNSSTDREMIDAMKMYLQRAVEFGVQNIIEFREGGPDGVRLLMEAHKSFKKDIDLRIMARPSERMYNENELEQLLSMAEGIGLSSYRDWDEGQLKRVAEGVNNRDKTFALHACEVEREPVEEILDLKPHHLVHMIEADRDDLEACAEENVPIVICPRSNLHFGKKPDIPGMMDAGVELSLGTDNGMIAEPNMLREMETAYRVARLNGGVEPDDVLMMSTWNPRKGLNSSSDIESKKGHTYMILERGRGDPAYQVVTRTSMEDMIEIARW